MSSRSQVLWIQRHRFGFGYHPAGKRFAKDSVATYVVSDFDHEPEAEHWLFAFDSDDSLRAIGRDVLRLSARCGLNYSQAIDEVWK